MKSSDEERILVERPNKTALKKEHHQVQQFAESLVKKPTLLKTKAEIPEQIVQQINIARKIKGNAYRRQIKHIANQLIKQGEEFLEFIMSDDTQINKLKQLSRIEKLRDDLIDGEDNLQNQLISEFPLMERQHLRNLIRQSRREKNKNLPMKTAKSLMHYLREYML